MVGRRTDNHGEAEALPSTGRRRRAAAGRARALIAEDDLDGHVDTGEVGPVPDEFHGRKEIRRLDFDGAGALPIGIGWPQRRGGKLEDRVGG